ncbi:MAG: hypothetical protein LBC61_02620 [Candidatus Peribacteria bacterium]|nr:hypothetical protein [Candidatus Peribacteria bacterium]
MKINFSKLYNSLENKEFSFQNKPIISLNSIYSKLDLDDNSDTDKYN